jgi:hypothetical protein
MIIDLAADHFSIWANADNVYSWAKSELRGLGQSVCVNAPSVHFDELSTHDIPLEQTDNNRTESKQRDGSRKPGHNFLSRPHSVLKFCYAVFIVLSAYLYLYCVLAGWVIFKRWDFVGLRMLLYGLAGLFVYHALIVIVFLSDSESANRRFSTDHQVVVGRTGQPSGVVCFKPLGIFNPL